MKIKYHYKKRANKSKKTNLQFNIETLIYSKNDFVKKLIYLMIPLSLQGLLQNVATTADSLMLGAISQSAMSATAIAVVFLNFQSMLLAAIGTSLGAMSSRYYAKEDYNAMSRINRLSTVVAMAIALIFFLVCTFFPTQIMSFYSNDSQVIKKGATYLSIVSIAYLFKALIFVRERNLCIVGLERSVTICTVFANILNIVLNVLLIYGIVFFPKLEIQGAAFATLISAIVEFLLVFVVLKYPIKLKKSNEKNETLIYGEFFERFGTCALQLVAYMVGVNFITAAFGHLNPGIVAVFSVINTIGGWISASRDGLQESSIILMGESLAECDRDVCIKKSKLCVKFGAFVGLFLVAIFVIMTMIFSKKYIDGEEIDLQLYIILLAVSSINLYFGIVTTVIQGATLIPGGDLVFNLFVDLAFTFFYAAPLFIFGNAIVKYSLILYIVLLKADEILKFPLIEYRSRKNIWVDNAKLEGE